MSLFTNGQSIEVGIGEDIHDENGHSEYIFINVNSISEAQIEKLFPSENVLYIEEVKDTQSIQWAANNPISDYLK